MKHVLSTVTRILSGGGNGKSFAYVDWEQFYRMQQQHDQLMRSQQKNRAAEKH